MTGHAGKAIAAAVAGAIIGWGANALTLSGRVAAIERGQERIEAQLSRLIDAKLQQGGQK